MEQLTTEVTTVNSKSNKRSAATLVKSFNGVNNQLSDIAQEQVELDEEMKLINAEINRKTAELKKRKKEIKDKQKALIAVRLVKLGERDAYGKQLKQLGAKVQSTDITKLLAEVN